jgi:hypothetical protein
VVTFAKLMQLIEGRPDARVETMLAEVTRMSDQELHEELERMAQLDENPIEEEAP